MNLATLCEHDGPCGGVGEGALSQHNSCEYHEQSSSLFDFRGENVPSHFINSDHIF